MVFTASVRLPAIGGNDVLQCESSAGRLLHRLVTCGHSTFPFFSACTQTILKVAAYTVFTLIPLLALSVTHYMKDAASRVLTINPKEGLQWTFIDKKGNTIDFEWCNASALEAVRSVYVDAYAHENLFQAFFDESNLDEARARLGYSWSCRSAHYREMLKKQPPEAYFAIAKQGSKIIGFALFDRSRVRGASSIRGVFPPEEVFVSPIMILPEAQGTGVGKELLFSILRQFPNLKKISLDTSKRLPASGFYRHLGFQQVEDEHFRRLIADPVRREQVLFFEWINPKQGIIS